MTRINPTPAKPDKGKRVPAEASAPPVTNDRHAEPVDVEAWRAKARAAELPASLVDWLVMHDAPDELWQDAIASWQSAGCWSCPDRSSCWGG